MSRLPFIAACLVLALPIATRADGLPAECRPLVEKGLTWLAKQQHRDGHWDGSVGAVYATAMYLCVLQLDREALPIFSGR